MLNERMLPFIFHFTWVTINLCPRADNTVLVVEIW